jgi:hypothetical protein
MYNAVFWDVALWLRKNRHFGRTYRLYNQGGNNQRARNRLLVTVNVVPSSPVLVTLMTEAILSSETPVFTEPHGVTSQKMAFFIVTAVKNLKSNTFSYVQHVHTLSLLKLHMPFVS